MSQRSYILCNYNVQDYSNLYDNHVRPVICEEGEVLVHKNSLTSQIFIEVHIPTQELFRPCSIFLFLILLYGVHVAIRKSYIHNISSDCY